MEIFNTGENNEQLRKVYNPNGSHLRNIQMRMLEMLLYLDNACKQAGVKFRIDGGTLLGAVRHKGFIPWDDDLDVAIDGKKEWKKLRDYLNSHPHPQFVLQDDSTDKGFMNFWMTLRDTKSEYLHQREQLNKKDKIRTYRGLQIDIFPFESGETYSLYRFARKIQQFKNKYLIGNNLFLARSFHYLQKYILHPILSRLSCFGGDKNIYMHSFGASWCHRFHHDILFPYKDYTFEGHKFPGPRNADKYLQIIYGNYMDLPPIDNRCHHDVTITIWE